MNRVLKIVLLTALVLAVMPVMGILAQGGTPVAQGIVNTDGGAGIYAEPNINSEVVGRLEAGETVLIYSESGLYSEIDGGWVLTSNLNVSAASVDFLGTANTSSDFAIRAEPSVTADVVVTLPSGSSVGVFEIEGLWAHVYTGDVLGWAFIADLDLADADRVLNTVVKRAATASTSSAVAVRSAPSVTADVLGTLEDGASADVLAFDESGLYVFVNAGDVSGWAFEANFDIAQKVYGFGNINAGPASFRDAADGVRFTTLPFDAEVVLLGQSADGAWLNVRYDGQLFLDGDEVFGQEGWVATQLVDTDVDTSTLPVTGGEAE